MTIKQETQFKTALGVLIVADMAKDQYAAMSSEYNEQAKRTKVEDKVGKKNALYAYNKCEDARKANQAVMNVVYKDIKAEFKEGEEVINKVVEDLGNLFYDIVSLSPTNQTRVRNLIAKIKK